MTAHFPKMAIETTRELFYRLVNSGVDLPTLEQKTGIDHEVLDRAEQRFPVTEHLLLWQVAEQLLPHCAIGLLMGAQSDPSNRGIVGLSFLASADLKGAIENKIRYTKILADHIDLEYQEDAEHFMIYYSIPQKYFHQCEIERVFSGFFNWIKIFTKQNISPAWLTFQYSQPAYIDTYQEYFQCDMQFNQDKNCIAFSKALLATSNSAYNDYLYDILRSRADNVLKQLDNHIDFIQHVRSTIAGRLCHGNFSAEEIAEALNISLRTLHRKLREHQSSYQAILDSIRKEMAVAYLQQQDRPYKQIPALLGYSDYRSFQRAFKRWMGCSPKQYLD